MCINTLERNLNGLPDKLVTLSDIGTPGLAILLIKANKLTSDGCNAIMVRHSGNLLICVGAQGDVEGALPYEIGEFCNLLFVKCINGDSFYVSRVQAQAKNLTVAIGSIFKKN
ncbi:hypothetical protein CHUAL_010335 [Chamberlinius hualienensis]